MRLDRLKAVTQARRRNCKDGKGFPHTFTYTTHNTHIHTQTYKSFHSVKSEFSVTNYIIMRSNKRRKREKFERYVSTKAQSV